MDHYKLSPMPPVNRRRVRVSTVLASIYTVALLLWLILLRLPFAVDDFWEISRAIGSWAYVPLWPLLLLALVRRSRSATVAAIIVLLIPLLLFGAKYGRQFLPNWHLAFADTEGAVPVRVLNWNSLYVNDNASAFEEAVRDLQPDLVAIQEAGTEFSAQLPALLSDLYPYQELYPTGGASGMAILSRYPIIAAEAPEFRRGGASCNCQIITVDVEGQAVTVINMHPWPARMEFGRMGPLPLVTAYSTSNQDELISMLIDRIENAPSPLLVLGDLNTSERQANYARMRTHLDDAFTQIGWGFGYTFPNGGRIAGIPLFPFIRIDYVFHDRAWIAQSAWIGAIDGSDHRYVVADLLLRP